MMKRVKKWGHSLVIVFNSEESKIYNLNEEDIVDIELKKIEKEVI